jgi:hypothetical protein
MIRSTLRRLSALTMTAALLQSRTETRNTGSRRSSAGAAGVQGTGCCVGLAPVLICARYGTEKSQS